MPLRILLSLVLLLTVVLPAAAQPYQPGTISDRPQVSDEKPDRKIQRREWDLSLRLSGGYDDNVPLVPQKTFSQGDKSSLYGTLSMDGVYRFVDDGHWLVGAGIYADLVAYAKRNHDTAPDVTSDPNDYNLSVISPSLFARRSFELFGRPAEVGMTYAFRKDWLSDALKNDFSKTNAFMWDFNISPCRPVWTEVHYRLVLEDFNDERAVPSLNSRDALRQEVGVSGTYTFNQGRTSINLGYDFIRNHTEGRNFDFSGNSVHGGIKTQVYGPVWLTLEAAYGHEQYHGFVADFIPPPGRESQDNQLYRMIWQFEITKNATLDIFDSYLVQEARQREFQVHRNQIGVGITYRF